MEFEDDEEIEDPEAITDDTAEVACPWCGEPQEIAIDPGGGSDQSYVQDCEICCRPWYVHVTLSRDGSARVTLEPLDGNGGGEALS